MIEAAEKPQKNESLSFSYPKIYITLVISVYRFLFWTKSYIYLPLKSILNSIFTHNLFNVDLKSATTEKNTLRFIMCSVTHGPLKSRILSVEKDFYEIACRIFPNHVQKTSVCVVITIFLMCQTVFRRNLPIILLIIFLE